MIWFIQNIARLDHERAALAGLESEPNAWLKNVTWRLDESLLVADADIDVAGSLFPVTLRYPYTFPISPPSVLPRGVNARWSYHQYGKGGELCLEWGADNWHPDITGAQMLASAHRLLDLENPQPETEQEPEIPSRDAPTLAQSLRGRDDRFIATRPLLQQLGNLPFGQPIKMAVSLSNMRTSLAVVTKLVLPDEQHWKDISVPASALDGLQYEGAAVRFPAGTPDFTVNAEASDLYKNLDTFGIDLSTWRNRIGQSFFLILATDGKLPVLVWLHSGLSVFSTVEMEDDGAARLTQDYKRLAGRTVCIVGCGSLGSKIATSLARSGVGKFELTDDDLFLINNLIRNDLDWRDMGSHKVDALSRRLRLVHPGVTVTRHQVQLNGQEASSRIAKALRAAATSDLIIDATGDPTVFNLLAAVASSDQRPMVWAEVLAGGIGGMIARFTPGRTPTPRTMRAIIAQWCADRGTPWTGMDSRYETTTADGPVLIADDADTAVIAAHATRLAIDALIGNDPPIYRYSAYFLGLKPTWIFREPFDTHPIDVGPPEEEAAADHVLSAESIAENAAFVGALIEGMKNEASDSD